MVFARELAVGLLDVVFGRAALDAEDLVVILVLHRPYMGTVFRACNVPADRFAKGGVARQTARMHGRMRRAGKHDHLEAGPNALHGLDAGKRRICGANHGERGHADGGDFRIGNDERAPCAHESRERALIVARRDLLGSGGNRFLGERGFVRRRRGHEQRAIQAGFDLARRGVGLAIGAPLRERRYAAPPRSALAKRCGA